ncbi:MAG: hypothetical protein HYU51_12570 [Candidatus Rokubacteria bacterium]|nr:hypothetical protein [Candidatus Rokubacteria bacterium]
MTRVLTETQRRVLYRRCFDHLVASCTHCERGYMLTELTSGLPEHRAHTCRQCRADLTPSLLDHLYRCREINPPIA